MFFTQIFRSKNRRNKTLNPIVHNEEETQEVVEQEEETQEVVEQEEEIKKL